MTSQPAGDPAPGERMMRLQEAQVAIAAHSIAIDRGFAALVTALAGAALELCEGSGIPASPPASLS